MGNTITVRLPEDLAKWLDRTAKKTGVPRGRVIREQLEKARRAKEPRLMRLAGAVDGPSDLSSRKGYSKS